MNTSFKDSPQREASANSRNRALPVRERVLEAACEMFAEAGFHGTHLREVCKRAGTNVAGVCYHFRSKEGLYEAVCMEAGRRLSAGNKGFGAEAGTPPEQKVLELIEALLQRLGMNRAWIAKLLSRELVNPISGVHNYAASGLEWNFILLQALIRELLGPQASHEVVRFHALSVLGECVFYSLLGENTRHPLCECASASPARLAGLITARALAALGSQPGRLEVSNV